MSKEKIVATTVFPANFIAMLQNASSNGFTELDRITDMMARQGVVRARTDDSRLAEWEALRPVEVMAEAEPPLVLGRGFFLPALGDAPIDK